MEKNQGWISLHRKVLKHWLYPNNSKKQFSEFEAWIDLLLQTAHKGYKDYYNETLTLIPRGHYLITQKGLSTRWGWHKSKVNRFLKILESENMIKRTKINPKYHKSHTLLKVVNYNKYQDNLKSDATLKCTLQSTIEASLDSPLERPLDRLPINNDNNEINNVNKEKEENFQKINFDFLDEDEFALGI